MNRFTSYSNFPFSDRGISRTLGLIGGLGLVSMPIPAEAHLVNSGLGPFYDGVTHFALSPECFLTAIGLALLAGLSGKAQSRTALGLGTAAWLIGALCGHLVGTELNLMILTIIPLLLGITVALALPIGNRLAGLTATVAGGLLGFGQGAALAAGKIGLSSLLGNLLPAATLLAIAAAVALSCVKPWTRVAVRVAGSWIAAISLLVIGWLWKESQSPPGFQDPPTKTTAIQFSPRGNGQG